MENFKISVNVGAGAAAVFRLTYEELLKRQHGVYELQIKVRPKQLVENFQIEVDILERQNISFLEARGTFLTNELLERVEISRTERRANVVFRPSLDQQRRCPICSQTLLDGDFVVKYDVEREKSAGDIQIVNGYFVHYFAPSSLSRVPKNVMFVIDCSGSMSGRKIKQTLQAFTKILEDLPEDDHLGILRFNSQVTQWKENLVKAEADNIQSAKRFVAKITANGGTNINSALLAAATMLKKNKLNKVLPEVSVSIIIFLSDGAPTSGVEDLGAIRENVRAAVGGEATLYSLGFGEDVDYDFLEKMSLENGGLARRIYEDSDSALQLQNFYKEVAFPVLLDVTLQYPDLQVNDLTQSSFRHYYQGSELIVAGHIQDNDIDFLTARVTAQGVSEQFSMTAETKIKDEEEIGRQQSYIYEDFTERLWAYLTVEQMLTKRVSADEELKGNLTEEALRLCLKYGFVTPLTSMVITTSEENDGKTMAVANKPKETGSKSHIKPRIVAGPIKPRIGKGRARTVGRGPGYRRFFPNLYDDLIVVSETGFDATEAPTSPTSNKDFPAVALISLAYTTDKIYLGIDESPDTWINLLHSSDQGTTLNGKLSADKRSFTKLGFVKDSVSMEITADNITVINSPSTQTYNWTSALQGIRYIKKEGSKLRLQLKAGLRVNILLSNHAGGLYIHVESQTSNPRFPVGLIGQMTTPNNILVESSKVTVVGSVYNAESSSACDFSSFGVKRPGRCVRVTMKALNPSARTNHIVSGIFDVPVSN